MSDEQSKGPDLVAELGALLGDQGKGTDPAFPGAVTSGSLKKLTQRQLSEAAKKLGLSPASKIKKDALADLILDAWQALVARRTVETTGTGVVTKVDAAVDHAALSHKFEVGEPGRTESEQARQVLRDGSREIPWGYDRDRVTAMPIDPDRLFAYWEVVDESIARARAQLGKGGAGAWLNLRVYDITARIFDGTNAHSTVDHRVERGDRQWFLPIGRPTSELIVEIGLKSDEGFFAKIARSGRIEFPRREPAPLTDPEWLTVRMATGQVERVGVRGLGRPVRSPGPPAAGPNLTGTAPLHQAPWEDAVRVATGGVSRHDWEEVHAAGTEGSEGTEGTGGTVEAHRRFRWEEPATITSWEAGPFPYPVEVPEPVREAFGGKTRVFRLGGRTHVVYGPWQVVIRGLGAEQSRVVLSRWEIYRSWAEITGHQVQEFGDTFNGAAGVGASERMMGASDRRWVGGSEVRLGGSSELFFLKASETRLGGASERMHAGSSTSVMRGSSERRFQGASEQRLGSSSGRTAGSGVAKSSATRPAANVYPPPPVGHFSENDGGSPRKGS